MEENERRGNRVCFSGYRTEKLMRSAKLIQIDLGAEILEAIADGAQVFISGMAQGVDIWAAEIVLRLRSNGRPIKLICACPYRGFEKHWSKNWKKIYYEIIQKADFVKYVCNEYNRGCFQTRNEWMVDHAARVIAVFNGKRGGTKNTIEYAIKNGVPITYIDG